MIYRFGSMCFGLIAAIVGLSSSANARFAMPADGPLPFRRDRVALDPWAILAMSKQLEILACGLPANTPEQQLLLAKTLALALALDSSNTQAQEQLTAIRDGLPRRSQPDFAVAGSKIKLWNWTSWLESSDTGNHSQSLARHLSDVMRAADPDHPKAKAIGSTPVNTSWEPWVPPLAEYVPKEEPPPEILEPPESIQPTPPQDVIKCPKATIETVGWKRKVVNGKFEWSMEPIVLEMSARKVPDGADGANQFRIQIGEAGEFAGMTGPLRESLNDLMQHHHGELPKGVLIRIRSQELVQAISVGRKVSMSAASAVVTSAALSGHEPNAMVLGQIDADGNYRTPSGFWDQLQAVALSSSRRVVVPDSSLPYLQALLAMEKPEFFMNHEVLVAKDFSSLIGLSSKDLGDSEALVCAKFAEIRDRMNNRSLRDYIGNPFIRQRLVDIVQAAPWHLSAKMLLLQASGQRPTTLTKSVLGSEIRRAMEPTAWMVKYQVDWMSPSEINTLGTSYEESDRRLDVLERYCERGDRPLFDKAREVMAAFRGIDRATRARGETYVVNEKIRVARQDWLSLYRPFMNDLYQLLGETIPFTDGGPGQGGNRN